MPHWTWVHRFPVMLLSLYLPPPSISITFVSRLRYALYGTFNIRDLRPRWGERTNNWIPDQVWNDIKTHCSRRVADLRSEIRLLRGIIVHANVLGIEFTYLDPGPDKYGINNFRRDG